MLDDSTDARFRGVSALVGAESFERLRRASVCVVGLGGVGSWTVEALARSGVGRLTLVDLDEVCVTNVNRQLHALTDTIGLPKAEVLAERVRQIHPTCDLVVKTRFFSETTADDILSQSYDCVVDAIDRVTNKALLIAACRERGLPVITTGSAGDRLNPLSLQVCDLASTVHDALLSYVRKRLRQKHGFPRDESLPFDVPCIYAPMQRFTPRGARPEQGVDGDGNSQVCDGAGQRKSCNDGLGSVAFFTGAVGFIAAAEAVKIVLGGDPVAKRRAMG